MPPHSGADIEAALLLEQDVELALQLRDLAHGRTEPVRTAYSAHARSSRRAETAALGIGATDDERWQASRPSPLSECARPLPLPTLD